MRAFAVVVAGLFGAVGFAEEPLKIAAAQNSGFTRVLYTPDGLRLAGMSYTGEVLVWDTRTGKELGKFAIPGGGFVQAAAFVNDGGTLAVATQGTTGRRFGVHLMDTRTGKETAKWDTPEAATSLAESPDGKLLAAGCVGKVRLFDPATGEEKTPLATPNKEQVLGGIGWTPDGKKLLVPVQSAKGGSELLVWEVESGAIQQRIPAVSGYGGRSFAVLPGGVELMGYTRADPKTGTSKLAVWSLETGKQVRTLKGEGRYPSELTLTPDGKHYVAGDMTGSKVVLADVESGKVVQAWPKWYSTSVAVSPDGNSFASCGSSADAENPTAGVIRARIDQWKK